ncbi:MAG: hypothetical protein E7600_06730 [Ruminococcaceae bacterium]|nr:hypothetical protein [Oscillospiraceae bacterium]
MLTERFIQLLQENKKDGNVGGFLLSLKLWGKLKKLIKTIKTVSVNPKIKDAESIALWIKENFPRVEEDVRSNIKTVRSLKRIESHNGLPRVFSIFSGYFKEYLSADGNDFCVFFKILNIEGDIDLHNAHAVLPLVHSALYDRIMTLFLCAFDKGNDQNNLLESIEKSFEMLDNLSVVTNEDVFVHNKVEKTLVSDPSDVYVTLSEETKSSYRRNLYRLSKKYRLTEQETAQRIIDLCQKETDDKRHVGYVLCDRADYGKTYIFLAFFLTLLFTVLLCIVSPWLLLSFGPVYGCVRMLLDKIYIKYILTPFCLPRIELDKIPDKCGILVVITTLLTGGNSDENIIRALEKMYFSNGGENVYFGILADLSDSDTEIDQKDSEILSSMNKRILQLRKKYGDSFFLFVRDRKYNPSQEKYMAFERKRGAVTALTKYLCCKSDSFAGVSIKPSEDVCNNIKYVFTLDSDTNLAFDCLKHMAGIMLHPQNKPVCDKVKGIVTNGYGILQPCMSPTIEASSKTYFTKIMCGHGGVDVYSSGGTDIFMPLFGRSVFCGKGMFEKNCYYDTLCGENEFKKNLILSHDSPEGARLRCAYVPDVTLTDSFPKEELSYYKRKHRWIRGDIQNIGFLLSHVSNSSGKRIKNNIGLFAKLLIFDNIYEAFKPIFVLVCAFASIFFNKNVQIILITVAFSVYILPFLYSVLYLPKKSLWHNFRRVYSSDGLYTGIWTSFMLMLFRICSVPKSAIVSADAIIRSVYRMNVSGKKTLEWMTAAQSDAESNDGLLGYVKKNLFSAFCGCVLFVVSSNGFLRLVSLMWLFLPLFAYRTGKTYKKNKYVSEKDRNTLYKYLEDMWKFFREGTNETTNNLPPDNIAVFPQRKVSRMTSPTNIGFYMLSCVIAAKSGIEEMHAAIRRINDCADTLEKLPKYKGLLYNWYDVFKAKPMNPLYVSSVDLGNYAACLSCVLEGLKELPCDQKLIDKVQKLVDECDLSPLFDSKTKLFFIGGEQKGDTLVFGRNKYDMLMSEARLSSYISVARRHVPYEHLARLSRRTVKDGGYMGYASWSGTGFEYFLPELFISSPHGSMLYEALCFCYRMQKKEAVNTPFGKVFGISESCYNEMDAYSNYKYRAFGIQTLALDVLDFQKVVSPYTSFLFMPMSLRENLLNLERLENIGLYGEYGFYESADFERKSTTEICSPVRCYMSHHVGMSIAGIANVLFDDIVRKWFSSDVYLSNAADFAKEKIPYNAYVMGIHRRKKLGGKSVSEYPKRSVRTCNFTRLRLENLELYAKRDRLSVKVGNLLLFMPESFGESLRNIQLSVEIDNRVFVIGKNSTLSEDGGKIVINEKIVTSGGEIFDASLFVTLYNDISEIVRMRFCVRQLSGEAGKTLRVRFSFSPLLDSKENANKCTYFEDTTTLFNIRPDGFCAFENRKCGIFLYSGITVGKKQETSVSDGVVLHSAIAEKNGSVHECMFSLSVSSNEKCAWTGLARVNEKDFESTASELAGKKAETEVKKHKTIRVTDVSESVSCAVEGFALHPDFAHNKAFLIAGKKIASVIYKDGLGFCFVRDANKHRISEYCAKNSSFSERVMFTQDEYDLCKNADSFCFKDGTAVYSGEYKNEKYRVEVFIPENEGVKIIRVISTSPESVSFHVQPPYGKIGKYRTGGGFTSFSDKDGTCFVYGFCAMQKSEACYETSEKIVAEIKDVMPNELREKEYVFVIGCEKNRNEAEKTVINVRNELTALCDSAKTLYQKLYPKMSLADPEIKEILRDIYGFSDKTECYLSLIDSNPVLRALNLILLAYTDGNYFKPLFCAFVTECENFNAASKMLCILAFCEYIRIREYSEFADVRIKGEPIYRHMLSLMFEASGKSVKNAALSKLRRTALLKMAEVCSKLRDERSAQRLKDDANDAQGKKDGIFL